MLRCVISIVQYKDIRKISRNPAIKINMLPHFVSTSNGSVLTKEPIFDSPAISVSQQTRQSSSENDVANLHESSVATSQIWQRHANEL